MSIIHKGIKLTADNYIDISQIENMILRNMYRVGDIIMTTNIENPSVKYGGSWVSWGIGKVPVGIDVNQTEFDSVEKTGGEKTHVLSVAEMPIHSHGMDLSGWHEHIVGLTTGYGDNQNFFHVNGSGNVDYGPQKWNGGVAHGNGNHTHNIHNTGSNAPHNNLQPYITCYFWKKTL